ncbi:MAG: bifunctional phosphopantothenoylcysteine decarboxylase/phosphopantothenate synthase [Acidobacteriota bacterium]|nr:bifunctional phosphopantothenoylcysteine decarboxylase/phosphopantothenate synthase [Acidobacteriota bacterium]
MSTGIRVLLGVSGGIAAYKAALLVRALTSAGHSVRCALTRSAEAFVSPLTLEVLTGQPVYRQEYLTPTDSGEELHITAAQWAQVLCLYPATANLLGKLAHGLADDFLTTTALAFTGPVVVAPAMHSDMWTQPAVQHNVELLDGRGVVRVGPVVGPLANGATGMGRLAEPEAVAEAVTEAAEKAGHEERRQSEPPTPSGSPQDGETLLRHRVLLGRKMVVTAGPTHEPVDPVRFLGNRSSGKMGFAIAAAAARQGAEVILIAGPVQLPTPSGVRRVDVTTALEMDAAVASEVGAADVVVMTAAVADFRPRQASATKIKKGEGVPEIPLTRNPDILKGLAEKAPQALRIGFAAETGDPEVEARAKLQRKGAHWIVGNDVSRSDIGFGGEHNEVTVYRREGEPTFLSRRPKDQIAEALVELVGEHFASQKTGSQKTDSLETESSRAPAAEAELDERQEVLT